jgi:hypothetical protein
MLLAAKIQRILHKNVNVDYGELLELCNTIFMDNFKCRATKQSYVSNLGSLIYRARRANYEPRLKANLLGFI